MKRIDKINKMQAKIDALKTANAQRLDLITADLQVEYNKLFSKHRKLQAAIKALDKSNKLELDEADEVFQWVRLDLSQFSAESLPFLKSYLNDDLSIEIDIPHENLKYRLGPSLIINADNGDVYDQDADKNVLEGSDYTSKAERNALIETYMKRTGYYPGVYVVDREGSVKHINTNSMQSKNLR